MGYFRILFECNSYHLTPGAFYDRRPRECGGIQYNNMSFFHNPDIQNIRRKVFLGLFVFDTVAALFPYSIPPTINFASLIHSPLPRSPFGPEGGVKWMNFEDGIYKCPIPKTRIGDRLRRFTRITRIHVACPAYARKPLFLFLREHINRYLFYEEKQI